MGDPLRYTVQSMPVHMLDHLVLADLRDGRKLIGTLISFDAYGAYVLKDCKERHFVGLKYADEEVGMICIRGENIALIGTLRTPNLPASINGQPLERIPLDEIKRLQREQVRKPSAIIDEEMGMA